MDDVEAIKQLKARYFRTMDTKDWAGMRQVFTDDVIVDTTASGGGIVTGADAFVEFLQATLDGAVTVHHGHMPEIDVTSPATATRDLGAPGRHSLARRDPPCTGTATITRPTAKSAAEWRIASSTLTRLHMDLRGTVPGGPA